MLPPATMCTALPWPLLVIDFEASSLELDSYPIEVGLALWAAPDAPVLGWSALIRPDWEWAANGHWSAASARVHRISKEDLRSRGQFAQRVAVALDAAVVAALGPSGVVWCDGSPFDDHWLATLFEAGGVRPSFVLGSWARLVDRLGPSALQRAMAWLERTPTRHRARADAEQLMLAVAHAAGAEASCGADLAEHLPKLKLVTTPEPDADPNPSPP